MCIFFFFQAEDGIRDGHVTGVQTCALPIYENVLKKTEAHYLALGHHADDQVETMLMALTKVTRPEVLSGIPISRFFNGSEIIRPLLSVNKIAIETYCEKYRIHPRYDA